MDTLRTPEHRFSGLDDFPWVPRYADLDHGVRMAYVDEGPRDAPVVLMLHGEPTWGYLYRHMTGPVLDAGLRVVVPDLIGFGRSDKPTAIADYSYARHVDWVTELLDQLALDEITLFCQDWGSLIGLRIAGLAPGRFARIVVGNGFLPAGQVAPTMAFRGWRAFARFSPVFPVGRIVATGSARRLTRAERAAYDAPFPDRRYLAGARAFPLLVPTTSDDPAMPANEAAWAGLGAYERPFLTLFGRRDPILGKGDAPLQAHVPGAARQPHARLDGSHFVQEDCGPELARRVVDLVRTTSTS
ncbi:haloalkane dehalogenase [Nocardioides sp.]|uniref:haloalkane dehalogenase n=1 Tax=Nocardioides sp. TaxID=35761 RepID=UPI003219321E